MPENAAEDALHIALATAHGMDYLLTWNCRHIANAEIQLAVASKCLARGYELPVICRPEELMGDCSEGELKAMTCTDTMWE